MSIINGPFDLNGSFGNFRSYYDPATRKRILGKKGGITRKQFETLPSLQLARENANEFGGRSRWASLLKQSLSDLKHLMFSRCFNKIMTAGKLIQRQDSTSLHGYRMVAVNNDLQAITQIDFNERCPFRNVIRDSFVISLSPDKKTVTLGIPGFIPAKDAWWMTKFNALRLTLLVAQTADMVWNPVNENFEPVVSDLELISRKVISDWISNNSLPVDLNLSVSFDEPAFSSPGTAVVVALGVEFSTSSINGQPCTQPNNGSMAVVRCFSE